MTEVFGRLFTFLLLLPNTDRFQQVACRLCQRLHMTIEKVKTIFISFIH